MDGGCSAQFNGGDDTHDPCLAFALAVLGPSDSLLERCAHGTFLTEAPCKSDIDIHNDSHLRAQPARQPGFSSAKGGPGIPKHIVGPLTAPPASTELASLRGIDSVKEFGVVISADHRHEVRRVSPLVVLFHKDLPNVWPTSVAQLSSMTQPDVRALACSRRG
ncbi:hypothetical protein M436DRAFT_64018 [Aureobasidium namibiae CBS 147.97]|uniref:Uncharacterized protein n=1 Tax=Aureobasidium namibiae CBS 147.97 TaxID=1043004 RepID=A0A074XDY9_9PEZI|nr:uncharacterized protein M436DRAFT_64018 [Aureobasidium namibiae CBS 147.97]KEQ72841.1 hypothetical protein M436DRAFT_64018 [Aureobasidium namibiae CBS 147.97]